jgi:hypothetical protein
MGRRSRISIGWPFVDQRFPDSSLTGGDNAIMLAIGLLPHLISVPYRIHELERMLDLLTASPDAGFFTGSQLADWYAAAEPAPNGTHSAV